MNDKLHQARILLIDFDGGTDGHRGQLNAMLARLVPLAQVQASLNHLFSAKPVLVPMIEHAPFRFLFACLLRSFLARRTVGLLFRPLPTLQGTSLAMRIKRLMCRILRHTPGVRVLTIIPFPVEPGFAQIAHGWIHDPQEWDWLVDPSGDTETAGALAGRIRQSAAGRLVCCAIGGQSEAKGFDRLSRLYLDKPELRERLQIAVGGRVVKTLKPQASALAQCGAVVLDRLVSDEEIAGLYAAADLVWCCYDRDYNQASGILGRAMQAGVPVVVRPGSVIEALCRIDGHPHVTLESDEGWPTLLNPPARPTAAQARQLAMKKAATSLETLASSLGVKPDWDITDARLAVLPSPVMQDRHAP